jgi:hypothetical protein
LAEELIVRRKISERATHSSRVNYHRVSNMSSRPQLTSEGKKFIQIERRVTNNISESDQIFITNTVLQSKSRQVSSIGMQIKRFNKVDKAN